MIQKVKLGVVPVGPDSRVLEVLRCRDGEDGWVELHEWTPREALSTERLLLTPSHARALAALLVQAAEGPPPTGFYEPA